MGIIMVLWVAARLEVGKEFVRWAGQSLRVGQRQRARHEARHGSSTEKHVLYGEHRIAQSFSSASDISTASTLARRFTNTEAATGSLGRKALWLSSTSPGRVVSTNESSLASHLQSGLPRPPDHLCGRGASHLTTTARRFLSLHYRAIRFDVMDLSSELEL